MEGKPSGAEEGPEVGLKTFVDIHNRKSLNEYR